ncbi:MAG: hypothetical protein JNK50_04360 [Bacteroidia bacterium]|nr:hypothetical protein [Bacteroidia bacterium]
MANRRVHFNKGNSSKIALVFSCPGQKEFQAGRPVNGTTGSNLDILLEMLRERKLIGNFKSRYDFRITNAYSKVLFNNKDNRTEARLSEIYEKKNLDRLYAELRDITDAVICFGTRASKAIERLNKTETQKLNLKIIHSCHLGLSSLNRIKADKKGAEGTKERLERLADEIVIQWG